MDEVPPRLHVIPATGCDKALVLRRGPANRVASLLWDRATGQVELGQWLNGRIYEYRCDLSPDARHMIVFARRNDARNAWTAISRAPWLTALAYFPETSMWHGGGAFDDTGKVWLNGADAAAEKLPDRLKVAPTSRFAHSTDGFHLGDLYAQMLGLRGWQVASGRGYDCVLTKPLSEGVTLELRFVQLQKDRAIISSRYAVLLSTTGQRVEHPDWEWADTFGPSLHVAQRGAIWQGKPSAEGMLANARVIHDFSTMTYTERKAPYQGIREER